MVDAQLSHPTYKFVEDSKADAFAWVFTEPTGPMKKVAIQLPEVKPDEIRAKVTYSGLCHSDLHTVRAEWGPCAYPIAPGHEIVGIVTQIGSEVKNFKVGDRVGFGCQRRCCETCENCKLTFDQLCSTDFDQKFTYGPLYWGGYATAIQHPEQFYFHIPKELPDDKVPPIFCAGVTTYAPIARHAKPGDKVAVLGIGGLGHMAVQYAKAWGCEVTAFTTSKDKEAFIKKLGADRVVLSNEETFKAEAGKFQLVLNTLPTGDNFNSLLSLTKTLGTFVQLGAPPVDKPTPITTQILIFNHINFTGSVIGSRKEIRECLDFSAKHNIVPLCETFDFSDFPKAFDKLEHGKPIFRCVVDATKASPQ